MKRLRPTPVIIGLALVVLAMAAPGTSSSGAPAAPPAHPTAKSSTSHPASGRPAGDPTASQLLDATRNCAPVSDGEYAMVEGGRAKVPVCAAKSAYFWTSDMAIDCDGEVTDQCNPDTDSSFSEGTNFRTSTGDYFTAETTHYFVIPLPSWRFDYREAGIRPGNVAAVIYNGKVVYAVLADLGPEDSIGEASYATADALGVATDPSVGGTAGPVTFVVFPGVVPDPVEDNAVIDRVGKTAARSFLGGGTVATRPSTPTHPPGPTRKAAPTRSSTPGHPPAEAKAKAKAKAQAKTPARTHAPTPSHKPARGKSPTPPRPSSPPATGPEPTGELTGLEDGCLDVTDGASVDGTQVQLYGCGGGDAQHWTVKRDGTLRALDKCMSVHDAATSDGSRVVIRTCDGSRAQQWSLKGGRLVNAKSGRCLDVTDHRAVNGQPLQIWTCTSASNQKWSLPTAQPSP